MSKKRFFTLISDYCRLAGLDAADQIVQGAPLNVDGVLFALKHDDSKDPGLVYVYCDLGPVPKENAREIYRTLLTTNMALHATTNQAVMVSPATGRILLGRDFNLDTTTAKQFDEALGAMADVALRWRGEKSIAIDTHVATVKKSRPASERMHFMRNLVKEVPAQL
ncbi:MAG TPA: CesT family type III secretion system chaperone [Noviherbaspirillum sp.]|nr:CesT family type III secretion system chaperone [Noviherbaspirillum sp.]